MSTIPQRQTIAQPAFAEVALPVHVNQTFTYKLTAEQAVVATLGARIVVPFGNKFLTGYIVGLKEETDLAPALLSKEIREAKDIVDTVPVCNEEILAITQWVSEYYASPWGEVIKAALPPGISPAIHEFYSLTDGGKTFLKEHVDDTLELKVLSSINKAGQLQKEQLTELAGNKLSRLLRELEQNGLVKRAQSTSTMFVRSKLGSYVRLLDQNLEISELKLTTAQLRILEALKTGPALLQSLLKQAQAAASTIGTLEKRGLIERYTDTVRRDPLADFRPRENEEYVLTGAQQTALTRIEEAVATGEYSPFLLHGVTGSGKTEVYIRAMRAAVDRGRSAMMLVPEIALTPVFSRRLRSQFGDRVAIFHSSLQRGERFDEWTRVRNGDARVVIGTRSAVFAPVENLGLIVVDEEHESSYRQQESPYYSGRDTAIVRAQRASATVVLGSATPSLESYYNARNGKYTYLSLPERIGARPMAQASLIDMREVFAESGKPGVFSSQLIDAIRATHQRGEQSIILLNRRGYSSFILCRSCGETVQCPNCDVTLTYHRSERVIVCHYCDHRQAVPSACPHCAKKYIYFVGEGTEQIEEILQQLIPELKIARIDRDTTTQRRRFEKSLNDFSEGRLDTLVGTQMLAKGHDFPNVTLVGVVSVDAGLALADFRAAERTFQLITQVAGRAGRGELPGRVLIQTYHPYHYALRHSCAQDYEGFYTEEMRYRQNHSYPPFVALASILVRGQDLNRVREDAHTVRRALDRANADRRLRILGPAPAPLARLKGEHRFQLLLKSRTRKRLREVVDVSMRQLVSDGLNLRSINLEIDPVSMM
ncbi:MAG TPA: primosomal protein N' [Pyrinomonadaceae bacterium]|nr:primosomal protein N' [Pyrinomonadaceae bacterium]